MSYLADDARQELLDAIAEAIDELGVALAALGDAYEQLDEHSADTLESELFRPVQVAYGRAQRTYGAFAARYRLRSRSFEPVQPGRPSTGVKGFLEQAVEQVGFAEQSLAELQDSLRPVEVGDPELRAGLGEVRSLLADLAPRAERFVSRFGR